jgi:hypothetical protein
VTARAVVAVGLLAASVAAPSRAGAADAGSDARASLSPKALYALAAFWYLRPDDYPALWQSLRARQGGAQVETEFGCIGGKRAVGELLERKDRDVVRLRSGTGLYGFMCPPGKRKSYTEDFAGGAIPIQIVEGGIIDDRRCAHPPPPPDY